MDVLLAFSQSHFDFRTPEWDGIRDLQHLKTLSTLPDHKNEPLVSIKVQSKEELLKMLDRSLLLKSAYEVVSNDVDHDQTIQRILENKDKFVTGLDHSKSWRVRFKSFGKKREANYIKETLQKYIDTITLDEMEVNLSSPDYDFHVIEDFADKKIRKVYFTLLIAEGQGRLKHDFNLKERKYIGNSTMDPELSFIQSNISRVRPNDLVLDPFSGTGGLLLSAAKFGAVVVGMEISYMIARAKGSSARMGEGQLSEDQTVLANFEQYKLDDHFCGVVLADASEHRLWRSGLRFDAIVADPPYGVREKGRKLGKKELKDGWLQNEEVHVDRFPEKQKYSTTTLYCDLMNLAAKNLNINGCVSYYYPVLRDVYDIDVLPVHPSLELIANCEQVLSRKGSRRLLCYRKTKEPEEDEMTVVHRDCYSVTSYRDHIFGQNN